MEKKIINQEVIGVCGELGINEVFLCVACCVEDVNIARLHLGHLS